MAGDGDNGKVEYGRLLQRVESIHVRLDDVGKKLDEILDPKGGLHPRVASLETAAQQNTQEHRTIWRLFKVVLVLLVMVLIILGPEAAGWIMKVV